MPLQFLQSDVPQPHPERARAILRAHPEVQQLYGRNPWTCLFVVGFVAVQLAIAAVLSGASWIWVPLVAYGAGAFVNHGLFVLNHECAHNLILPKQWPNLVLGIVGDLALTVPSAVTFRRYHLVHHARMGEYAVDGDIAGAGEARVVGASSWRKAVWVTFLGVSQAARPLRLKEVAVRDRGWEVANIAVIAAADVAIVVWLGPKALVYLFLSTFFALGLHPVGGRWIQEHFVTRPGQETYSYYGPLNTTSFNVGYHNEHHDFSGIPWNRLPRLTTLAPEHYDALASYRSWPGLLARFVSDRSLSLYSRVVRD